MTSRAPFEPSGPALLLGPGSTWGRVLRYVPQDSYTMVHGSCLDVGVGGYLLGGGYNYFGTDPRYLSGSSNVLQYTMVDANGSIYKVTFIYNNMKAIICVTQLLLIRMFLRSYSVQ